jgi:hypothetical protein
MLQTHLYITQTYIDLDKFYHLLSHYFFTKNQLPHKFEDIKLVDFPDFQKYLDQGRIIFPELDKKDDFREIQMDLEQHFLEPTIVFLGDVSTYSLPMQEGMLKLLEEPVPNLYLVLTSHDQVSLLETITSRSSLHFLPRSLVNQLLDQTLLDKVKQKLPPVGESLKALLKNSFELPDLKKVDRPEIDFWLWQLGCYTEEVLKTQPSSQLQNLLYKLKQAQKLNQDNVQKKFALDYLRV